MFIKEIFSEKCTPESIAAIKECTYRIAVRWVIVNSEWKIALIKINNESEWIGEAYTLPGWWVDGMEGVEQWFTREIREEVWANVKDVVYMGAVLEYREDWFCNHSHVFSATVDGELQSLVLQEDEKDMKHEVIWETPEKALSLIGMWSGENAIIKLIQQREIGIIWEYIGAQKWWTSSKLKDAEEIAKKAQYDYIMLKSEFDSYIRRMESDSKESKVNQLVELAKKLLPIIDQLGQSVSHIPADLEDNTWAAWVKLTYENAVKTLSLLWISQIPTIWHEPDMELHDPLSVEATEDDTLKGKIIREFQPWYVYEKDGAKKVITAAKVIVGQ